MTLSILLAVHLAYGALMAYTAKPRMLADGEVLGWPLVATMAPVALVTLPVGALLIRYAPTWFFVGFSVEQYIIEFERFHFALLMTVGLLTTLCTLAGMFFTIAIITRDIPRFGLAPFGVAGIVCLVSLIKHAGTIFFPVEDVSLLSHPVGLCSIAIACCLMVSFMFVRTKLTVSLTPA